MENRQYPFWENRINEIHIEIVEHGLLKTGREWLHKKVQSPFNRLYLVEKGEGWIENEQEKRYLRPGYMYWIPAGSRYDYTGGDVFEKLYYHIQVQLIPGVDLFQGCEGIAEMEIPEGLTAELLDAMEKESMSGVLKSQGILTGITAQFLERYRAPLSDETVRGYEKQREVFLYLERKISAQLKTEDVARELKLTAEFSRREKAEWIFFVPTMIMEHRFLFYSVWIPSGSFMRRTRKS